MALRLLNGKASSRCKVPDSYCSAASFNLGIVGFGLLAESSGLLNWLFYNAYLMNSHLDCLVYLFMMLALVDVFPAAGSLELYQLASVE